MKSCALHLQKKGMTFECPNQAKSCRGPEIRLRLEAAKERFRYHRANSHIHPDRDPDNIIYSGLHRGYSKMLASTVEKWRHVYHLPYMLWEARDPRRVAELLELYQDEVGRGINQHRVNSWWLDGESSLSKQFLAHARCAPIEIELE